MMTSGFGFAHSTTTDSTELTSMSVAHGAGSPGELESGMMHSLSAGTTRTTGSLAMYDEDSANGSETKGKARAVEG